MDKSLEEMTDEVIYRAMLAERPTLVRAVADLVAQGQSPARIEAEMKRRYGDIQLVRNVWHVARYLDRDH